MDVSDIGSGPQGPSHPHPPTSTPGIPSSGPLPILQPLGRGSLFQGTPILQDPAEVFPPLQSPDLFPEKNHVSLSELIQYSFLSSTSVGV